MQPSVTNVVGMKFKQCEKKNVTQTNQQSKSDTSSTDFVQTTSLKFGVLIPAQSSVYIISTNFLFKQYKNKTIFWTIYLDSILNTSIHKLYLQTDALFYYSDSTGLLSNKALFMKENKIFKKMYHKFTIKSKIN